MPDSDAGLQDLLEAMPDAVIGVNAQGVITLVNQRVGQMFGFNRVELLGEHLELVVPESLRERHAQLFTRYVEHPRPRPMGAMQLSGRRKDGTEFPAEISLRSFHVGGEAMMLAAVRDISDRLRDAAEREELRTAEQRLDFAERLHQAERLESLGLLAGGVAHDVNNMVGAILNYASFISEAAAPFLDGPDGAVWTQVQRDAGQVERAARRAADLTHQLLVFGRRDIAQPELVDLNEIVVTVAGFLPRTIGEQVELAMHLEPALDFVFADPGQIEQVLVNLAINARDAMLTGGRLVVDTANVQLLAGDAALGPDAISGNFVRLRVRDNGVGMDEATVERAFEPFFTTKPRGEGTGLGLSMVYGIVTQAGGRVSIESEPGTGSTISIWLPAADAVLPVPSSEQEQVQHRAAGGESVLVVEDDDALREVAQRILTENGYEVMVAADGAAAIKLARAHPVGIDLLLTDVVMPKMMGRVVAEKIRAIFPEIRVLFMSGYAYPVLTSQGVLDPDVILIEKPFTTASLLERVASALGGAGG